MFLIRITEQDVINADEIIGIKSFVGGGIEVFVKGGESCYVEKKYEDTFINHLGAINDNSCLSLVDFIKEWKEYGR